MSDCPVGKQCAKTGTVCYNQNSFGDGVEWQTCTLVAVFECERDVLEKENAKLRKEVKRLKAKRKIERGALRTYATDAWRGGLARKALRGEVTG